MTNQRTIKTHNSIIDSTCDTIVLVVLWVTILRLIFRLHNKVVRNSFKSISRGEDENKDFKISTKVEINRKGRDIVEKKISRFIE